MASHLAFFRSAKQILRRMWKKDMSLTDKVGETIGFMLALPYWYGRACYDTLKEEISS